MNTFERLGGLVKREEKGGESQVARKNELILGGGKKRLS